MAPRRERTITVNRRRHVYPGLPRYMKSYGEAFRIVQTGWNLKLEGLVVLKNMFRGCPWRNGLQVHCPKRAIVYLECRGGGRAAIR